MQFVVRQDRLHKLVFFLLCAPRSLQSWVATIQSIVLTADAFQLSTSYSEYKICTEYYEALGVRRSDMLPVYTYVCLFREESAYTTGRWVFCSCDIYSECEYMKNSVPWKRIHPGGKLDWCQRPSYVHRKPCGRRKAVFPFFSTFFLGGCTPFCHPP